MTYVPKAGDIGLTQIKGGVGRGIRFAQWLNGDGFSDFEHAFVFVGTVSGCGTQCIVEAEPGGARVASLGQYDAKRLLWLKCPPQYGEAVAAAALGYVGTPYSFAVYGANALHRFHIPIPHLKTYIASSKHLICSQLCDQAAMDGGWHLFDDDRWPGFVIPADLRRLAKEQP